MRSDLFGRSTTTIMIEPTNPEVMTMNIIVLMSNRLVHGQQPVLVIILAGKNR
jgi:hypothetical protein